VDFKTLTIFDYFFHGFPNFLFCESLCDTALQEVQGDARHIVAGGKRRGFQSFDDMADFYWILTNHASTLYMPVTRLLPISAY
jgi:hypothetical protein